jgi:hypothetical protein
MANSPFGSTRRQPRRTVTFRGQSSVYFGFTEFDTARPLPHAAGIYMLATETLGPDRWRIVLVGETANFASDLAHHPAAREALRRGATRALLHFSPLDQGRRLSAAMDLWMAVRSPLVTWSAPELRHTA